MNVLLKAKYSFISALAFFIVANLETFKFTQNLFGSFIEILRNGVVTPKGLLFHTTIFFALMMALMMIPSL